ncbi:helicase-associated domain-containing protein [Yinghuangia soli]|uniref:Helicase-associated domain-containing protein n=1 Tax=Yinghuangia soli TaxID=2908204 RepID=A0AA41Q650_9ACTN|nr:helicase-associated domain-containing protein [Yinghuangia soli]MCF2531937.1 helicase-associated domain-containing protein [Yinghuangia soli]
MGIWQSGGVTLSTTDSLAVYLASLSASDLARIVTTTPTVPDDPRPTTLRHVAVCLADPETALLACSFLSRGELQLLEVLWAVAEERPPGGAARLGREAGPRLDDDPVVVVEPDALLALVGGAEQAELSELGPALESLTGRVLAWPEDGRIRLHPGAAAVFPLPLGLGAPAYGLLLGQRAEDLQAIVRELGGLPAGRKDDNALLAARLLGDPAVVRRIAARLDPPARAALDELTEIGIRRDPAAAWGYYAGGRPKGAAAQDGFARLRRRGLLLPTGDGWEMMPREVALALRGDDYRVPFEARPPAVATVPVDRAVVLRESAAAASGALDIASRLLHTCALAPPQLLKSGGVGVREVRRLARELACEEGAVRLWLHIAESAGLLLADGERGRVLPTAAYDAWLDSEPAGRLLALVRGWVTMPDVPTLDAAEAAAGRAGRPPAPLSGAPVHGGLALVARGALLRTLGSQGPDRAVPDIGALARCVAWMCPTPFRQGLEDIVAGLDAGWEGPDDGPDAGRGGDTAGTATHLAAHTAALAVARDSVTVRVGPAAPGETPEEGDRAAELPAGGASPPEPGTTPAAAPPQPGGTPAAVPPQPGIAPAGAPPEPGSTPAAVPPQPGIAPTGAPPEPGSTPAAASPDPGTAPAAAPPAPTATAAPPAPKAPPAAPAAPAPVPAASLVVPPKPSVPPRPSTPPPPLPLPPAPPPGAGDPEAPTDVGGVVTPGDFPFASACDCPDCRDVADEIETAYRGRFDAVAFTAATLQEAALLGLVACGALTALGGGVAVQHSAAALLAAAEELLPPAVRRAHFPSDMTAVVTGTAAVELARLLAGCAEPEPSGRVWRFTEESVRRHLDAGGSAAGLLADLAAVAIGKLPQPLEYLIHDVGRRHGIVRAAPAAGVVYSDDEALITELLHHRGLAALRFRRIAPTVLLCAQPVEEAVRRLRRAGYAPAAETETGSALVERPAEYRADTEDQGSWPVALPMPEDLSEDWRSWAADLLDRASRAAPALSAKAARLHEAAPLLGPEDCLVLAEALDRGSAVRVAATAYNGEPLTSTVAHLAMAGDSLYMRPPNGRPALLPFRLETLWLVLPAEPT